MSLRELKKEVELLPPLKQTIQQFEEGWIKPLRKNTNRQFPFLQTIPQITKKETNLQLQNFQQNVRQLNDIKEKLHYHARKLIELKLHLLRNHRHQAHNLRVSFLHDDVFSIKQTMAEVKQFRKQLSGISRQYNEILENLQQHLTLEQTITLLEQPHRQHIQKLQKLGFQQQQLAHALRKEFFITTEQHKQTTLLSC